jgi:hypothetical protein
MKKKNGKAIRIGKGVKCPRGCGPMGRFEHPPGWRPKPGAAYWFEWWDMCRCGYMQMYEQAKRFEKIVVGEKL